MIYRPLAAWVIGLVVAYYAAVALLSGPLRSYVPRCDKIVIGFCFERNEAAK